MTVAIIQARTSSKRLPNKVMKIINGKRLISFVYDRVKVSKKINKIYIAISNLKRDDKLAGYCKKKKYNIHRGELNNVLGRYCSLIEKKGISSLVRVNGDSPCIDPKLIDKAIDIFKKKKCDMVTNVLPRTYPRGVSVEVIKSKLLLDLNAKTLKKFDREHVTSFFYKNKKNFRIVNFKNDEDYSKFTLAIDTEKNLKLVKSALTDKNFLHLSWKKIIKKIYKK